MEDNVGGSCSVSFDIFLVLCGFALFIIPFFIGFSYFLNRYNPEEDCVSYYKENHYITNKCEKYREKLENMEL